MKNKKLKPIPKFKTDEEFGEFWMSHDVTDYYDLSKAKRLVLQNVSDDLLNLKISANASKRLSVLAEKQSVSRTDLAKKYILEGLRRDQASART